MYKNFIISGSGRSGTKFLSHTMNTSPTWTVLHEPYPKKVCNNEKKDIPIVQKVLDKDFYGEVNSMRRRIFMDLDVEKHGVIIRNPFELWLSIANRKLNKKRRFNRIGGRKRKGEFGVEAKIDTPDKWIEELTESMNIIDDAVDRGAFVIYFHRMTNDVNYLQKVLHHFGIKDVDITQKRIDEKINATPVKRPYKTIEDIPYSSAKIHEACDWFYEKHLSGKI
ncbi:MAG: hypothetical protein ACW99G_06950 [Candidatus Thorarchaeota archaeon]|jgi:hypothetical protein